MSGPLTAPVDGLTDLALLAVASWIAWRRRADAPLLALAAGLSALSAAFGVAVWAGLAALNGPHEFLRLAAGAGVAPALAVALVWPGSAIAARRNGAVCFILVISGLGVAFSVTGLAFAPALAAALSAALLLSAAFHPVRPRQIAGALALMAGFAAIALPPGLHTLVGPLPASAAAGLCAATALALLAWPPVRPPDAA